MGKGKQKQFRGRHNTAAERRGPTVAMRTCLGCNRPFLSEGPWNRLCPPCSRVADGMPPMAKSHAVCFVSSEEAGYEA